MSNILDNFFGCGNQFRKYIPNPNILATITKLFQEKKDGEAERMILKYMPNPAIIADLKRPRNFGPGNTTVPEVTETPETPTTEPADEKAPEVTETPETPTTEPADEKAPEVTETPEEDVVETPDQEPEVKEESKPKGRGGKKKAATE